MSAQIKVGVIGGSTAGALVALTHRAMGMDVRLFERQPGSLGAFAIGSMAAVSENHSGAEYPFDRQSAVDCLRSRVINEPVFPQYVYGGKEHSLILSSNDDSIHQACVRNFAVLKETYSMGCVTDGWSPIFGPPDQAFATSHDGESAPQSRTAFLTPQRGLNPARFAAVLSQDVRRSGIDLRLGCAVSEIRRSSNGAEIVYGVEGREVVESFNYVFICCNEAGVELAQQSRLLPEGMDFQVGLRRILIVDMDNGRSRRTRLQLEGPLGGMWSPMSPDCSLLYSPTHFHMGSVSTGRRGWHLEVTNFLKQNSIKAKAHEQQALAHLARLFPSCKDARVRRVIYRVNINTVEDPRVRRNFGFVRLDTHVALMLLPKWTMVVSNALQSAAMTVSSEIGNRGVDWAVATYDRARQFRIGASKPETETLTELDGLARYYANGIGFPESIVNGFAGSR